MLIIANNINTRKRQVAALFPQHKSSSGSASETGRQVLIDLARNCARAGADILEINLQQHFDEPAAMSFAVEAVQEATELPLCLSCDKPETLEAGLKSCERPAIVNYISIDVDRLRGILPLVVKYKAGLVLLVSDPARPEDARQMLEKAAILVGAANSRGIANESILLDPGIFHITAEQGQRHLSEVMQLLEAVPQTFDPPVRTTCWISNSSAGAPPRLRPLIEALVLTRLSALGLSSVFMDVLRKDNMRTARLLRVIDNQEVYADSMFK